MWDKYQALIRNPTFIKCILSFLLRIYGHFKTLYARLNLQVIAERFDNLDRGIDLIKAKVFFLGKVTFCHLMIRVAGE